MMSDVNWWLMALAFVLGLLLTFAFTIRRVQREVPVYGALGRGPRVGAVDAEATTRLPKADADATTKLPRAGATGAVAAGAAAAGGAAAAKFTGKGGEEPYGTGSLRVGATKSAPSGYTVKADKDTMLYHTTDSPFYDETEAEVFFANERSAEIAGFTRWDKLGGGGAATAAASGAAAAKFADTSTGGTSTVQEKPYGDGSIRVAGSAAAPEGYTVKGNEDSMLYHTPQSPDYDVTVAEIWFRDVESAERAGFAHWDSGKSQRGKR